MNLPNKLTIGRVIAVPFFIAAYMLEYYLIAFVIFILASLTDMLDGKIARKYNLVTNFGKFMDPLADKLLVCSALICLVALAKITAWIVIIIIAREFIISGFRLVASDNGIVIAASYWGKFKTVSQMIMVILFMEHLKNQLHLILQRLYKDVMVSLKVLLIKIMWLTVIIIQLHNPLPQSIN